MCWLGFPQPVRLEPLEESASDSLDAYTVNPRWLEEICPEESPPDLQTEFMNRFRGDRRDPPRITHVDQALQSSAPVRDIVVASKFPKISGSSSVDCCREKLPFHRLNLPLLSSKHQFECVPSGLGAF